MSKENPRPSTWSVLDWAISLIVSVVAVAGAISKAPVFFWLPAVVLQAAAFGFALSERDGRHWPSTIFGCTELVYIVGLLALLAKSGAKFDALVNIFFGLIFVHGMLYLIAAKPSLRRRGYLKSNSS